MATKLRQTSDFDFGAVSPQLDAVNVRVLEHLLEDPRLTMSELGRRVGMSAPAVAERVQRLLEAGVITGFSTELSPKALGRPIAAYIRIRPVARQLTKVAEVARRSPEVVECHRITGEDCFLMKAYVGAVEDLEGLIDRFLPFGQTTTSIVQSSPVPRRSPPLPRGDSGAERKARVDAGRRPRVE
ncbi:Lrp/AsnC family transcriptional regulator [bacterium]|nr:MAG: Lrp/AsnC family transcriptional regulator [bacterium]